MNPQYNINSSSNAVTSRAIAAPTFISKLGQRYRWLPSQSIILLMTTGMVLSQCVGAMITGDDIVGVWPYVFFIASLALTVFPAMFLIVQQGWKRKPLPIDLLLLALVLSGVPGMLMASPQDTLVPDRLFFLLTTAYRCFLLFVLVPATLPDYKTRFENSVLAAYFSSTAVVILGSIVFALKIGYTPFLGDRLGSKGQGWLVHNHIGYYCATCIIACSLGSFIPKWIRMIIGTLALMELILTQSRTSMIALLAVTILNFFLYSLSQGRTLRFLAYAVPVCLVIAGSIIIAFPILEQTRVVQSLILRSQVSDATDPSGGRLQAIQDQTSVVSVSPLFGLGYRTTAAVIDNGYVSMFDEMGIVGLILYLIFAGVTLSHGFRLLMVKGNSHYQNTGRCIICFLAFMFVHALGEKSHGLKISDITANSWLLLSGYSLYLHTDTKQPLQESTKPLPLPAS